MAMVRFDPFSDMLPLREAMNRLFEDSMVRPTSIATRAAAVPMDVYAEGDDYVLEVAVPGIDPNSVDVQVLGNQITVSGEYAAAPEGRQYLHRERGVGRFERRIKLPDGVDPNAITASLDNGVLSLIVPKPERMKPKAIAIASGNDHKQLETSNA